MNSAWKIEIGDHALEALRKLDKADAKRITKFLKERLAQREDPRSLGHSLRGELATYWRYRVGDYRLICQIIDDRLVVLVLTIGHRRDVYQR